MCDPVTATVAAVSAVGAGVANNYVNKKAQGAQNAANQAAAESAANNQKTADETNARIDELEASSKNNKSTTKIIEKQAPQVQDPDVSAARNKERKNRIKQSSENSTLVTGGSGLSTPANTGTKRLFGE